MSPLSAVLYLETCDISGYYTQETQSCVDLRQSAQWPGAGTASLLAAFGRATASSTTPLSNVILFLLVGGNSRMRNGAKLVGENGEKSRHRTPVRVPAGKDVQQPCPTA